MAFGICSCASTADINATYDPSAVTPTLTLVPTGVLVLDGVTVFLNNIVLIKDQIDQQSNGIYYCTVEGAIGVNAVLSRYPNYVSAPQINNIGMVPVELGIVQGSSCWIMTSVISALGEPILFSQIVFPLGTTSITTLGDITTGTWDAGHVTAPYLEIPTTTSSTVGVIRKNGLPFIHGHGSTSNFFAGLNNGNFTNTTGVVNIGIGNGILNSITTGAFNLGLGSLCLSNLTSGNANIDISNDSQSGLSGITTGSSNFGVYGGSNYTSSESNNICIYNLGVLGESNKMRLGTYGTGAFQQNFCYMDPTFVTKNGRIINTTSVTGATYTALTTDDVLICNRAGAIAITLLASPETGRTFTIKDDSGAAAANNITITPAAGNIDGAASYVISTNYASITLIYNGTQWNII